MAELRDRGCEAAGYRLAGAQMDHVCARHLYGDDRMLTAWPAEDHAVVVAVGRHDQSSEDVYTVLLMHLGLRFLMRKGRSHPVVTQRANHPRTQMLRPTSQTRLSALGESGGGCVNEFQLRTFRGEHGCRVEGNRVGLQ